MATSSDTLNYAADALAAAGYYDLAMLCYQRAATEARTAGDYVAATIADHAAGEAAVRVLAAAGGVA